nr:methyltransferase [bacterium]
KGALNMDIALAPGERVDTLPGCGLRIVQREDGFCYGTDAVLLAAFARAWKGERVLDLGTGTGVLPLLLSARTQACFTGIELDPVMASLAGRSVALNALEGRITVCVGDYTQPDAFLPNSFHVVVCNPPYQAVGEGPQSRADDVRDARHESSATMEQWIAAAHRALHVNGRLYAVHRADRMGELIGKLHGMGFAIKRVVLVCPLPNRAPNRVLVACAKGGASGTRTEIFTLYQAVGCYTPAAQAIYKGGML